MFRVMNPLFALSERTLKPQVDVFETKTEIYVLAEIAGVDQKDLEVELTDEVRTLVEQRVEARSKKDFSKSDEIRDKLKTMGILIEDTKDGYKLKYI